MDQSLIRCLSFVHQMKTTGKVKIPVGPQKEKELKFLHQIVNNVEKHQIPPSLTINFDQTLSKYVQVLSTTMDQKGESNVPIAGISDNRSITNKCFLKFVLTMLYIYVSVWNHKETG